MVLKPEMEKEAKAIFKKWGLDFAIVGETTDDLRFRVIHQGEEVANLPIKELGDEAPEYDRPWSAPTKPVILHPSAVEELPDYGAVLLEMLGSPDLSSRRWVWEQYDTYIQGNSLIRPGGDAGVVRVEGSNKALAFTSDVNPRYCEADAFEGGKQAVAECFRNLTAVGATPLAATDNLNFGNPERPEIMGQFVRAVQGIGEACKSLDMPIVSGNVSLYNETHGKAILPTPTIGAVGLLEDADLAVTIGGYRENDAIFLIGEPAKHLGQSSYLRICVGREEGAPPPVDLEVERRNGACTRQAIRSGLVTACHDLSDGGLAIGLAEMTIASGLGMNLAVETEITHAALFGEDQARYLCAVSPAHIDAFTEHCAKTGTPATRLGTAGGDALTIDGILKLPVEQLRAVHESWFPAYMSQEALAGQAAE